jgi:hypothetical protein
VKTSALPILLFLAFSACTGNQKKDASEEAPSLEIYSGMYSMSGEISTMTDCASGITYVLKGIALDTLESYYLANQLETKEVYITVTGNISGQLTAADSLSPAYLNISDITLIDYQRTCELVKQPFVLYHGTISPTTGPENEVSLLLNPDHSAFLVTDFMNGDDPLVEKGSWKGYSQNKIAVSLGSEDGFESGIITFDLYQDSVIYRAVQDSTQRIVLQSYFPDRPLSRMDSVILAMECIRTEFGLPLHLGIKEDTPISRVLISKPMREKFIQFLSEMGYPERKAKAKTLGELLNQKDKYAHSS